MIMFSRVLLLCIAMAASAAAWATAQVSDVLMVEGKQLMLNTNPLDSELERLKWQHPEGTVTSTANWRGYVATWEIRDAKLFLKDVEIRVRGEGVPEDLEAGSILRDLYPNRPEVFADWYSGALIVPDGEMTSYVHMGYGSSFDRYQVFRVSAGRVVEHLSFSGREFQEYKDRKFDEFMQTEQFKRAMPMSAKGRTVWMRSRPFTS